MASNFKISIHKSNTSLHLKLLGDFDGSSAYQLLNAIKKNSSYTGRIFLHTAGLKNIHPFGRDVFTSNLLQTIGPSNSIIFTGENSNQIAPKGSKRILSSGSFMKIANK